MTVGKFSDLAGKVILVTGASSGIGRGVAISLAEQGVRVLLTGRNELALRELGKELSDDSVCYPADLTCSAQLAELVEVLPAVDGVFHSAGMISPFPAGFLNEVKLGQVMSINFESPALLTSALLRQKKIRRSSSLVFMSSVASGFSYKGSASYSASKAALEAYSRSVAIEHASMGIRANCILAAMVRTPIFEQSLKFHGQDLMRQHQKKYPLGVGDVSDISELALFLLSSASRWMTGASLVMDGGLSAGR
ncbi:MAG: SDR family NAD(P)-dependent oxidoreductase [Alcanivoracaceae bacterium]|nr:SDR family NAD(P)-dependent oxidoreductase [Alcanivoracaceae bacterium]